MPLLQREERKKHMGKKDREFWESAALNNAAFNHYYNRLMEIAISRFEWGNLPDTVDERFMELIICSEGRALFFKDEVLGYLALRGITAPPLDVNNIPTERTAIAANGYHRQLDQTNSVIIFYNMLRTIPKLDITMYAKRLYNLDRIIDVNSNAQKTPILIECTQEQELTLKNIYMQYQGNMPAIIADKSFNPNDITVLKTDAPYCADKIYALRNQIWNDALTFLGITNVSVNKKERLLSDEVTKNNGAVMAARNSVLEARERACQLINKMFNLNVYCRFKEEVMTKDYGENIDEKEVIENE